MGKWGAIFGLVFVAGCTAATGAAEDVARDAAKGVVNSAVASQFPGLDATMVTDCIIDNASMNEVFMIARDTVTTPSAETLSLVSEIAARPATIQCFTEKSKSLIGL